MKITNQEISQPAPEPEALLDVVDLKKHYPIFSKGFIRKQVDAHKAVDGVSFKLQAGETLGLVGESGCGKTTCVRTILRAVDPTAGKILFRSKAGVVDLATRTSEQMIPLRTEMQMIFQDPMSSLNPRMTVAEIVSEPMLIQKIGSRQERRDRVAEILHRVGLQTEHMTRYPHAFSGGQRQRIGIARALILRPSLVVCDEAVSALDVSVQAQVIDLLVELQRDFNLTYIFVSHDLSVVRHISDRVAVMHRGKIVEMKAASDIFSNPEHPYTQSLLSAVPYPDPRRKLKPIIYRPEVVSESKI
jgi:peptide/nickel transport system ATP-binding protein